MIKYQLFPRNQKISSELLSVVDCFLSNQKKLDKKSSLKSNEVLELVRPSLESIGYKVERSKKQDDIIEVPVLFGENGITEKMFLADALSEDGRIVVEVEAGRAVLNNQFLKDIFEASMMLDVEYLVLAVKNTYKNKKDYEEVKKFLETLFASDRLILPLKGILLVGYG